MTLIEQIIGIETDLVVSLIELLKQEQDCLKLAAPEALAEISDRKIAITEQLDLQETERRLALGLEEKDDISAAMTQWLSKTGKDKCAAEKWEQLLSLAREAKLLNNINARLVGLHLHQNTEALRALTTQPEIKSLYGSKGQAAIFSCSRIVDSA